MSDSDWERLLAAERHVQALVKGAVLVGGTAAVTVLLERLGDAAPEALKRLDALYPQASGASVLAEVIERLSAAAPGDLAQVEVRHYKGLVAPWNSWDFVVSRGRQWAARLAVEVLKR